jgi:RimJ/RimL family protein N-acetyltransferase
LTEFSTQQLILRSIRESDEGLYCELFCDPDTMRYIGPPWTRAEAQRAFRDALGAMRATPPRGLFVTVIHRDAQRPIGLCTLQNFDRAQRRAELGLMLVPSGRAYGAATEALMAFIEHAFATLPFDELWVRFAVDHAAARRTAMSSGLVRHSQAAPEDRAASLWRWSACRSSWRSPARKRVSVHCSAADD